MVNCLGKIYYDEDKVPNQRVYTFVGFDETKSRRVKLETSKLKMAGIFPGVVCVITGNNPKAKMFYVHEIFTERILELPPPPKESELCELTQIKLIIIKNL